MQQINKTSNESLIWVKLIEQSEEDILHGRVSDQNEMFDELEETYFLAKSQVNAKRLDRAIAQLEENENKNDNL